ncbi:MAG: hypothetical protein LUE17_15220 [Planctomycetaceae bacterium]|nr:hypothetical protein [Planctomycetaceae bacterium]
MLEYPYPIQISDKALKLLCAHHYPGNIRQLQNIVERLVVTSDNNRIDETLTADILAREPTLKVNAAPESGSHTQPANMEKTEQRLILSTLRQLHGNKAATCKALGISKSTLWRKLKKYEL